MSDNSVTQNDGNVQDIVTIDHEALAFYIFERDYERFNPRPVLEVTNNETQRQKLLRWLRVMLIVSAVALMVLSALNTFPEFARLIPDWWQGADGEPSGVAMLIGGGAAVLGVEGIIFVIAALMRVLPSGFKKSGRASTMITAYVLAMLIGALANQDFLIRPYLELPADQRMLNAWTFVTTLAFGIGRFALMVAAGDSMAVLFTAQDKMNSDAEKLHNEQHQEWRDSQRVAWEDRRSYWLTKARGLIADNTIPAGALEDKNIVLLNPTMPLLGQSSEQLAKPQERPLLATPTNQNE